MITGDLHGHRRNFNLICRLAALDRHPRRHLILQEVCHGGPTYPQNGGCMSHAMLEDVAGLIKKYPNRVHFILGNHELAELTDYPIQKNKQMLNLLFRLGLQQMYGPAADNVREAFRAFCGVVRWQCVCPAGCSSPTRCRRTSIRGVSTGYFPSRVGPLRVFRAGRFLPTRLGARLPRGERPCIRRTGRHAGLITGHEPCNEGFQSPNSMQIILDCCGEQAGYLVLPMDGELSQAEIVRRIRKLA